MQFDNIRVSRKLWGAFLGLMIAILLLSAFAQNRGNSSMLAAMDAVVEIAARISAAVRWRGATETAVTMVMGGAVTTCASTSTPACRQGPCARQQGGGAGR